jgi:hypothetical protein
MMMLDNRYHGSFRQKLRAGISDRDGYPVTANIGSLNLNLDLSLNTEPKVHLAAAIAYPLGGSKSLLGLGRGPAWAFARKIWKLKTKNPPPRGIKSLEPFDPDRWANNAFFAAKFAETFFSRAAKAGQTNLRPLAPSARTHIEICREIQGGGG